MRAILCWLIVPVTIATQTERKENLLAPGAVHGLRDVRRKSRFGSTD
jgi:hypothetical protein